MIILRYIGQVNAQGEPSFLMGVPARDLSEEDVDGRHLDVAVLVDSGLYEVVYDMKESVEDGGDDSPEKED